LLDKVGYRTGLHEETMQARLIDPMHTASL
jgi:hypothetical protein